MLKMILDEKVIYVLMGGAAACGIISKLVVSVALKRLVKASGSMNKSTHPLMRLVRAKFEHACMLSEKVENVKVFVDKYLYEYRVLGMKLHSLRRLECASAGACLVFGLAGAVLTYTREGMKESVLRLGAAGAGLAILVFLMHLMTDENYHMAVIRNYMVDYLENICLHRYGKASRKEVKVVSPEVPVPEFGQVAEDDELLEEPSVIPGLYDNLEISDEFHRSDRTDITEYSEEVHWPDRQADTVTAQEDLSEAPPRLRAVKFRKKSRKETLEDPVPVGEPLVKPSLQDIHTTRDASDILAAAVKASEPIQAAGMESARAEKVRTGLSGTEKTRMKTMGMEKTRTEKPEPAERPERKERKEKLQDPAKEILIRQILEEFMA